MSTFDSKTTYQLLNMLPDYSKREAISRELEKRAKKKGFKNIAEYCGFKPNTLERTTQSLTGTHDGAFCGIRDIGSVLRAVRTSDDITDAVNALLDCGWDYRDPKGLMKKSAEEITGFLESLVDGFPSCWKELHPSRRNLLQMIMDAYFRAFNKQNRD